MTVRNKEQLLFLTVNTLDIETNYTCINGRQINIPAVLKEFSESINYDSTVCPNCGGRLRERSGPYGRFYGCTNYPQCRYSRPIRKY